MEEHFEREKAVVDPDQECDELQDLDDGTHLDDDAHEGDEVDDAYVTHELFGYDQ